MTARGEAVSPTTVGKQGSSTSSRTPWGQISQRTHCTHDTVRIALTTRTQLFKMSLQAPSLSLRSKSPSRNSGATKAVILVTNAF